VRQRLPTQSAELHTTARTHFGTRTTPPPFTHTSLSEELDPVGTLQLAPRRTAVTPASSKPLPATFGHLSHTAAQAFQLVVAFAREMEKCTAQRKHCNSRLPSVKSRIRRPPLLTLERLNPPPGETSWFHPFAYKRFHVLLKSLFKVLCNLPSRFLFAIGFSVIFSLTWSLPRALGCTLKQPDSSMLQLAKSIGNRYGPSTHYGKSPCQRDLRCAMQSR